jgi:SAM-dependent methyltransferase
LQDLSQPAARADVRPKVSAQLYEQLQDFNSITRRLHSYRHRNLRGLMTELRGQIPDRPIRALEIGCAAGRTYGMLAQDFPLDYLGIDFRPDRVALAQQRYADRPARFVHGDATDKAFYLPDSADIVFALETLEHIAEGRVVRIVEDVCRTVRPRLFVVSVPVEIGPTVWVKALGSRLMGYDRAAGYNASDLFWAGLGQLNRVRTHEHNHRGFNWRWLEQTIRFNARLRETRSMPFAWLPRGLATNVMFIAEPGSR